MKTKRCNKCKRRKSTGGFYTRKDGGCGLSSWCKSCNKKRRDENRAKYRAADNKATRMCRDNRRRENAKQIVNYLSEHPCVDCGEDDVLVLDFDHDNPSNKILSVAQLASQANRWSKVEAEIAKCSVRCANCHRRKTVKQLNHLRYQIVMEERIANHVSS